MLHPLPKKNHIEWPDNCYYFLTVSTFLHYPYFKEDNQKQLALNFVKKLKTSWNIPLQAFAIPLNHIHLIFFAQAGSQVTFVKRFIKNNISREYRKNFTVPYKDFWQSIRVLWVRNDDQVYWNIIAYIIGNLLKHKEVSNFQELYDSQFCSFSYIADKYGFDFACNIVRNIIAVDEDSNGTTELTDFKAHRVITPVKTG